MINMDESHNHNVEGGGKQTVYDSFIQILTTKRILPAYQALYTVHFAYNDSFYSHNSPIR